MNLIKKITYRISLNIRRRQHKKTAYIFRDENDGWEKVPYPVLGNKQDGIFYDPFVRWLDDRFVMYVSNRTNNCIVRCESFDGITWSKPIPVLHGTGNHDWRERVNRASVVYKDGIWYMWYTGMSASESKIGMAFSEDGINFNSDNNEPILIPEMDFEKKSVMNPCVIWDEEDKIFKMWYAAGEKFEPDVLCYATSKDGKKWDKYENNPVFTHGNHIYDQAKVGGCDIIKTNGGYIQFYIGYENIDNARICAAFSKDGINWERYRNNPILCATKSGWDADAVYKPTVCYHEKEQMWYLWYNGRKAHDEYIGLARKNAKIGLEMAGNDNSG